MKIVGVKRLKQALRLVIIIVTIMNQILAHQSSEKDIIDQRYRMTLQFKQKSPQGQL
jgi:hypothetical protein